MFYCDAIFQSCLFWHEETTFMGTKSAMINSVLEIRQNNEFMRMRILLRIFIKKKQVS